MFSSTQSIFWHILSRLEYQFWSGLIQSDENRTNKKILTECKPFLFLSFDSTNIFFICGLFLFFSIGHVTLIVFMRILLRHLCLIAIENRYIQCMSKIFNFNRISCQCFVSIQRTYKMKENYCTIWITTIKINLIMYSKHNGSTI